MSLVGYRAQNHQQQVKRRGADPAVDDRGTPWDLIREIESDLGASFTLDAAASAANAKAPRFYSLEDDGLEQPWSGELVWCNPPFSHLAPWVEKAWAEHRMTRGIVMLLPANRCEQPWWQDWIEGVRDMPASPLRTQFLRGRTRFDRPGATPDPRGDRPPFGCVLATWIGGAA